MPRKSRPHPLIGRPHGSHVVLVTGGRDYDDEAAVWAALDLFQQAHGIQTLVSGMAQGAHTHAVEWAKARGVPGRGFPALWRRDGKAAGPIRNQRMLQRATPSVLLAFPGGRWTADMVARAERAGLPVMRCNIRRKNCASDIKMSGALDYTISLTCEAECFSSIDPSDMAPDLFLHWYLGIVPCSCGSRLTFDVRIIPKNTTGKPR